MSASFKASSFAMVHDVCRIRSIGPVGMANMETGGCPVCGRRLEQGVAEGWGRCPRGGVLWRLRQDEHGEPMVERGLLVRGGQTTVTVSTVRRL